MIDNLRFPSKFWWYNLRFFEKNKTMNVINEFLERRNGPIDGQPNFFSKFSSYSYLEYFDWLGGINFNPNITLPVPDDDGVYQTDTQMAAQLYDDN